MEFKVFIQCNRFQTVAAEISRHTFITKAGIDPQNIVIMNSDEIPALTKHEGDYYLRNGRLTQYSKEDCQSFTLSRFYVPTLMGFKGHAIVVDPDVFFLAGKEDLEAFDFKDKAVYAREKVDPTGAISHGSSVMFLDCSKLRHWDFDKLMDRLFSQKLDYYDLMWLRFEDKSLRGEISPSWNDIDHLDSNTRMIHYSERITQPWMKGVRFDRYLPKYSDANLRKKLLFDLKRSYHLAKKFLKPVLYVQNPFEDQEKLFFQMANAAIKDNPKIQDDINQKLSQGLIRSDIFECLARAN